MKLLEKSCTIVHRSRAWSNQDCVPNTQVPCMIKQSHCTKWWILQARIGDWVKRHMRYKCQVHKVKWFRATVPRSAKLNWPNPQPWEEQSSRQGHTPDRLTKEGCDHQVHNNNKEWPTEAMNWCTGGQGNKQEYQILADGSRLALNSNTTHTSRWGTVSPIDRRHGSITKLRRTTRPLSLQGKTLYVQFPVQTPALCQWTSNRCPASTVQL